MYVPVRVKDGKVVKERPIDRMGVQCFVFRCQGADDGDVTSTVASPSPKSVTVGVTSFLFHPSLKTPLCGLMAARNEAQSL